jgi:hypothetical protein
MMMFVSKAFLLALCATFTPAKAQTFLVYGSGESPDRMVVFANLLVRDRTPMDAMFGPELIKQIEIDIVFEAPEKPEWTDMTLEFACPREPGYSDLALPGKKKRSNSQASSDVPARFRIVSGSENLRNWKTNEVPPEDWTPVTSELFNQVRKVACNEFGIQEAIKNAAQSGAVDAARFRTSLSKFGLQDIVYVGDDTYGGSLSDIAWTKLWTNSKRPERKGTGRQLTAIEIAERDKKYAEYEAQMADIASQAGAYARPKIDDLNAKAAFTEQAAKIRGSRKINKLESVAISVWQGRREYDVGLAMGPARITDMEGLRFLNYATSKEVPVSTVVSADGQQIGDVGGQFASCDVQFVMAIDSAGTPRVADVIVRLTQNDPSFGNHLCEGAVKAPQN